MNNFEQESSFCMSNFVPFFFKQMISDTDQWGRATSPQPSGPAVAALHRPTYTTPPTKQSSLHR